MTLINPPRYLQAGTYTANNDRLHGVSALYTHQVLDTSGNFKARGGVLSWGIGGGAAFSINTTPSWSITVGPFAYLVENDYAVNGGDYIVMKVGNDVLSFTPSSPTLNRIDTVAVQVVDAFYSGSLSEGRVVIVQGTATSGTAVAPTLPPSCEPIADISIAAGSTAPTFLSDRRVRSGVMGGIIPITGAQYSNAGAFPGEVNYYEPLGTFRVWRGGSFNAWRAFGGILARGGAQLTTSVSLATGQEGNFAQAPLIDPGGIWAAQATMQMEYGWTPNDARVDLTVSLDGVNNGGLFGTSLPLVSNPVFPVSHSQLAAALATVLTGSHTIWFNAIRTFGSAATVSATPYNFRAAAIQLLLRAA